GLEVGRAQIGLLSEDGSRFSILDQWIAPGIADTRAALSDIPVAVMAWSKRRIDEGEDLVVRRVSDLPPEAAAERLMFEWTGTRSGVLVPLTIGRQSIGFVSFQQVRRERDWTD